ncbi:MAG: beta galactosidase jelly roll domain-containing protein [Lachnospiraceae bacterium]|nr:beta galactosidase jelly roll domain-containing protein [Lachnospiraceae bacterium]
MIYTSFSLNGAWEMYYQEEKYTGNEPPFQSLENDFSQISPEGMGSYVVEQAVPGYWEDMTEAFLETPFFRNLKINPEYGIWQYPIAGNAPDMALPNVIGNFFYRRSFWFEKTDSAAVLHFAGVQNAVSVWVNDVYLGRHEGYSAPFEMKIQDDVLKDGENTIVLSVSNHRLKGYAGEPVSGLTSRAANECSGGITGDVELRVYNSPLRDASILISEDCESVHVKVEMDGMAKFLSKIGGDVCRWKVCDGKRLIKSGECSWEFSGETSEKILEEFSFDTCGLERWSPENPKLYTLEISCREGALVRSFGVRRLVADGVHFRLNDIPYYLRGICEHCYFPETVHPNHDAVYYRSIIRTVKKLGFNFIRFHTWVPEEEYLQAADELGMLIQVECPNNTTLSQWEEIVKFCRRHPSVVIYCCGNELLLDDPFIEYLRDFGTFVHENTDALFSPMSAMRGVEYFWAEPEQEAETREEPLKHHPRRIRKLSEFGDLFSSYANGQHSYTSLDADPQKVDAWSCAYNKPRVSHEICIDGTYADLSLKDRYKDTRIGKTEMFSSIERHLLKKGLLKKAPLYFINSSEWQRRVRKYCFEAVRRSNHIAGYDFLGPLDTHWHTFGYDVGMMNEFYEMKPGETVRNVLMYNSAAVLLTDLGKRTNFTAKEALKFHILISYYGKKDLEDAHLCVRLSLDGAVVERRHVTIDRVKNGTVSNLYEFSCTLPDVKKPGAMKLYVTLDGCEIFAENEWELYLFPDEAWEDSDRSDNGMVISEGMELERLERLLEEGRDVLLLGTEPFASLPTTFRIALAGRTGGNLATVIHDHPVFRDLPNDGFCGWQFARLLEGGQAICFESDEVPFHPIIEVASVHKYAIRQAALFEFQVMNGRLLVCSLRFDEDDPAARWLRNRLISYLKSEAFHPADVLSAEQLRSLAKGGVKKAPTNTNFAFNVNDKTAVRGK